MSASIPKTMRAAQLVKYKQAYEMREVPTPEIGDNDLLIRVGAAGFCHTDYQVWEGVYSSPTPLIPSHEPVGTVAALGSKVEKAGKFKVGDAVGVLLFRHQCRTCIGCETTNDIRFCKNKDMAGLMADGGMAEYIIGDAGNSVLLPDGVPFEQAAPLMCAGATTWTGLKATGVKAPAPVGILGIGGLGSLGVQFAKAIGHPVVAIDNRPEGRALAAETDLRADLIVDFKDPNVVPQIKSWAGGDGLAAILVCTDNVAATKWSLETLRPHGVAVPLGLPPSGFQFNGFTIIFNELTVRGSLVANIQLVEEMMKVVAQHKIRSHVTTVGLEDVPKLPDMYMDPHLKGRLVMKLPS